MNCNKCKKIVKEPLLLYDGSVACPLCGERMDDIPERLFVTEQTRELFSLSELYFNYGFQRELGIEIPHSIEKLYPSGAAMIEKATAIAREAARLGHPEAVYKLGFYYDKDYLERNKTEAARCKNAARHYLAVCLGEEEFEGYGTENTRVLKKRAKAALLAMISALDKAERQSYYSELRRAFGSDDAEVNVALSCDVVRTDKDDVLATLKLSNNKSRAPLFGIFRLPKEELIGISEQIPGLSGIAAKTLHVSFIPIDKNGTACSERSWYVSEHSEEGISRAAKAAAERAARTCVLFFFVENGKSRYYTRKKKEQLLRRWQNSDFDNLSELINSTRNRSFVFYDDDIFFAADRKKSKTMNEAAATLIGKIISRG